MAIAWSPMQAYLSPLFTLNQQAFICHDLGRVIPWADIEKWEVHTIWIGARGNTMAFELTIVLQGKSRELLPCKYSRTRIESKLGYNAERNPKTLKNSRIPIQRTKIILRFERFPKDMDRNTLTSMLATYKPTYSKDS
ncbi:hypothetical protein [Desulfovibrio litoralis]|nr:hypothetical protein [Desulfovibrio litoralis]